MNDSMPWVEKYRPLKIDDIVLDEYNKMLLNNIIKTKHFPNLLLYGPPGTGKTTTITNLINEYQTIIGQKNQGLMIHLNASDERGIDIIRNQIASFVTSSSLFSGSSGIKFVVLDEVDYMTQRAQQALKQLLQSHNKNVRYCLICNYINRIDTSLQKEFIRLRFSNLPPPSIHLFISKVLTQEHISISNEQIDHIQKMYKSDIRSMVNYIQSNQSNISTHKIINNTIWDTLTTLLTTDGESMAYTQYLSTTYRLEQQEVVNLYIKYYICEQTDQLTSEILDIFESLIHSTDIPSYYYTKYSLLRLSLYLKLNNKIT
jgi:replication factor C subunit 3/5